MRLPRGTGASGIGPGRGPWPILLLLVASVVLPTACVLWFMAQAVQNERAAVQQRLADAYRSQLKAAAEQTSLRWRRTAGELSCPADQAAAAAIFERLTTSGVCDAVVLYGPDGKPVYPPPEAPPSATGPVDAAWERAARLEFVQSDFNAAASAYGEIASRAGDVARAAQALQGAARCLAKSGRREGAIGVLAGTLQGPDYATVRDAGGRLIAPGSLLMAIELMPPDHPSRAGALASLTARLNDYGPPPMPAAQRRFLMRRLQEAAPDCPPLPTLSAEELAERYLARGPSLPASPNLNRTDLEGVWRLASPDGTGVGLFREERIREQLRSAAMAGVAPGEASVEVLAPGQETSEAASFAAASAGEPLGGWHLALHLEGVNPFSVASQRQTAAYLWTALLVIAFTAVAALTVVRYVLREVKLTRLRTDFIATVSHELRTPLASMRLIVDTLLEGHYRDQAQASEYLQLLAKENERLSRLIDNFLSFSRMERNKRAFEADEIRPEEVVAAAADVVRGRFESGGCRFDVDVAPDLPVVAGDRDALVTVLLNLLDNAFKYSENDRHIVLRARAEGATVCFEVQDNGIGLSSRAIKRIFDPFYQVDRRLSRRTGGCGLGLSIVRFIVDAHGGAIEVQSQPGKGSTFAVKLPRRPSGTGEGPSRRPAL